MRSALLPFSSVLVFVVLSSASNAQDTVSRRLPIDWNAVNREATSASSTEALQTYRASSPPNLDDTRVPVLIIGSGPVRSAPRIKTQDYTYVASYALDRDATMSIMGTSLGTTLSAADAPAADLSVPSSGAFTPLDDEGNSSGGNEADYSFNKFGASYTLRLSCRQPGDERCLESAFAESVANTLVAVGGKP